MDNYLNKKVAILGLGIEGRDLCEFFLKEKAQITVFDQKSAVQLGEAYENLKIKGVNFVLGKNYLKKGLNNFDYLFRSPGFKLSFPAIKKVKNEKVVISSATKLFFDLCPGKIIGVTGTKGKGTTATLIYQILKNDKKDVFLAGNIGQPMLSLLPKLTKKSWLVLELSSFQLIDLEKSPHLAVVLFIASEHLDYHQDNREYVEAKANLVKFQGRNDLAVINADDPTALSFSEKTKAKICFFSRRQEVKGAFVVNDKIYLLGKLLGKASQLQLRGQHNWENVCAAAAASHLAGSSLRSIKKTIFSFKGLEHRLELVKKVKGVEFYNDSFSTTPETTIAAVASFTEPIILIAGGSEKGSDFSELGQTVSDSTVKTLILIGEMAARLKKACQEAGFKGEIVFQPKTLREAVTLACKAAKPGEVVLLSPACASFDMFVNYKERGKQFKEYVQKI